MTNVSHNLKAVEKYVKCVCPESKPIEYKPQCAVQYDFVVVSIKHDRVLFLNEEQL
jgi:hypothetical protein